MLCAAYRRLQSPGNADGFQGGRGGWWGGKHGVDETAWPQRMEVDYVRVYQARAK